MAGGLVRFGQRYRLEAAQEMRLSQARVRETAVPLTPIKTGRMREQLRAEPTDGGFGYFVGWLAEDFRAVAQPFYPLPVVLGTRHMAGRDPITPALELDRAQLTRGLGAAALRAARG
jgi:hypothetical protein